jgi:hypothetical protein
MPLTALGGSTGTVVIGDTTTTLFPQTLHPQVMNYISRLSAAGYSPSRTEINAVNNLILGMVANGIYDKCDLIYPVIGSSTSTVGFDLKNAFNATFTGSWTVASTGMKPTTASTGNRADTGWNPSVNGNGTNDHLSIYLRTPAGSSNVPIGCAILSTQFFQINGFTSGNILINNNTSGIMSVSLASSAGYWLGSRTSASVSKAFVNGTQVASTANTANARPNLSVALGVRRTGSASYDTASSTEIAFVTIGDGLSDLEARTMWTLVQAYQSALSRQV